MSGVPSTPVPGSARSTLSKQERAFLCPVDWSDIRKNSPGTNVSGENSAWQYRNLYLEMTRDKA